MQGYSQLEFIVFEKALHPLAADQPGQFICIYLWQVSKQANFFQAGFYILQAI